MKVYFTKVFTKDLSRFRDAKILARVKDLIQTIETLNNLGDIDNLKKLQGHEIYYRIRVGNYRLGMKIEQEKVTFMRFLHRREIYRYFP
ncbi:MAG: type II toxin-antitoxin system RelE family toxin [Synechocystis sp.]|jgi:mRNA interferase RelE/StbE